MSQSAGERGEGAQFEKCVRDLEQEDVRVACDRCWLCQLELDIEGDQEARPTVLVNDHEPFDLRAKARSAASDRGRHNTAFQNAYREGSRLTVLLIP